MTDITGFGLVGHALEVAAASQLSITIEHRRLPLIAGALEYGRRGYCSSGLQSNMDYYSERITIADDVPKELRNVLFDPQTSGGLLVFCDPARADAFASALAGEGILAAEIGATAQAHDSRLLHIR